MILAMRHTCRLAAIAWAMARRGALFWLKDTRLAWVAAALRPLRRRGMRVLRPGERLALAFQDLGPAFIKLGQFLSTRSDLVSEEIAEDLALLRDRLPPFGNDVARHVVEEALGGTLETLFASFEAAPVAAASIAQVHFAVTREGREVAVKILRPGIAEAFARDLEMLSWLAASAERFAPGTRRMRPREMIATLRAAVAMELDLRYEAAAAAELRENLRDDAEVYIPEVFWPLTAAPVLTLERIAGAPIDDAEALRRAGLDADRIVENAASSLFKQVFRDGFFHADPHPGNLFVLPGGRIGVVDFGITGRLEPADRLFLAEVLHGFLTGDYRRVAEVHFAAGIVPPHQSADQFALACRAIAMPILGRPIGEISLARLLAQLFQVSEQFEMRLQPQFLLLQKTMMVAEGIGRKLNPGVNMWKMTEPLIAEWGAKHLGRRAALLRHAREAARHMRQLPEMLEKAGRVLDLAETRLRG